MDTAKDVTPEEALEMCLTQMANGSSLPFDDGVRKQVYDSAIEKFKKNHGEWPGLAAKVLRAARKVGEYSDDFARLEAELNEAEPTTVRLDHVRLAIHVVRHLCPARAFLGAEARYRWCPEA